ncbi:MAG: hypothetical protein HY652_15205 [Acidobacteria bacterium]|nr:hypothetical protein [Acidobacteriota bacterium]
MSKISWNRVIVGGLVAGLIINLVETTVNGFLLSKDWEEAMTALGKAGQLSAGVIGIFWLGGFLLGISVAYAYAATRPRFGPGAKNALRAGFTVWFLVSLLHSLFEAPMGLFPTRLYVITTITGLVEFLLAGWAAGWIYKEAQTPQPTARSAAAGAA